MKNKGFTLMELLGSITILAIIAIIAFPALLNLLGNSQNEIDKAKQDYAISAAREYVADNNIKVNTTITIGTLINEGYLNENTISDGMEDDTITYVPGTPSTYTYTIVN